MSGKVSFLEPTMSAETVLILVLITLSSSMQYLYLFLMRRELFRCVYSLFIYL